MRAHEGLSKEACLKWTSLEARHINFKKLFLYVKEEQTNNKMNQSGYFYKNISQSCIN